MEESQPLDVSEPDITEYIDRIAELDKELTQSKEEIERLNNELSAL
jgi:peptidoglycan hydrolase CwlO-like protein